jgi:hypothetical protein
LRTTHFHGVVPNLACHETEMPFEQPLLLLSGKVALSFCYWCQLQEVIEEYMYFLSGLAPFIASR